MNNIYIFFTKKEVYKNRLYLQKDQELTFLTSLISKHLQTRGLRLLHSCLKRQHFLLFRQCFQKTSQSQSSKLSVNSLPNIKILDWSNLKAFADNKIKLAKMMIFFFFVFDRVENIVGKGENAGNQHFLLSPQCFQKLFTLGR